MIVVAIVLACGSLPAAAPGARAAAARTGAEPPARSAARTFPLLVVGGGGTVTDIGPTPDGKSSDSWSPGEGLQTMAFVNLYVAALGDSYSARNGTPDAVGPCAHSPQAWPHLIGAIDLTVPPIWRGLPLAGCGLTGRQIRCSGAAWSIGCSVADPRAVIRQRVPRPF